MPSSATQPPTSQGPATSFMAITAKSSPNLPGKTTPSSRPATERPETETTTETSEETTTKTTTKTTTVNQPIPKTTSPSTSIYHPVTTRF